MQAAIGVNLVNSGIDNSAVNAHNCCRSHRYYNVFVDWQLILLQCSEHDGGRDIYSIGYYAAPFTLY